MDIQRDIQRAVQQGARAVESAARAADTIVSQQLQSREQLKAANDGIPSSWGKGRTYGYVAATLGQFSKDLSNIWSDFVQAELGFGSRVHRPTSTRKLGEHNTCAYYSYIRVPSYWAKTRKSESPPPRQPIKHIKQGFPLPCPDQPPPETVSKNMSPSASVDERYFADLYVFVRELAGLPRVQWNEALYCASRAYTDSIASARESRRCHSAPHNIAAVSPLAKQRHDACVKPVGLQPGESLICSDYHNAWDALVLGWTGETNTQEDGHYRMLYMGTNEQFAVAFNPASGAWVSKYAGAWPAWAMKQFAHK